MKLGFGKVLLGGIVLLIVIVAVLWVSGSVPTVKSSETVSLQKNATFNFYIPTDSNVTSAFVEQSSNDSATVYLGKRPLLLNNILILHLSKGQAVNASLSNTGNADIGVTLVSSTPTSATLLISYIPPMFGVKQSPGIQVIKAGGVISSTGPSQSSTTTIGQSSTTSVSGQTTTVASTTTVQAVNQTQQAIMAVNATYIGILANNFKSIFIRESTSCTRTTYDTEFSEYYAMAPSGPETYANTSLITPVNMKVSGQSLGSDLFNVTYIEITPSGNRTFAIVNYNSSSGNIQSSVFKGDFGNNYNAVKLNYTDSINTTDQCSIYGV